MRIDIIANCLIAVVFLIGIVNIFLYMSNPGFLYFGTSDHAIIAHAVWNFTHYNHFGSFIDGVHFSPLQWLIVKIVHLFYSDVNNILVFFSSFFVLLGIIPVYLIARKIFPNIFLAWIIFPLVYLMFPSFHMMRFLPHHELMIPFLFLTSFYFLMEKRYLPFIFFLILLLGVKENVSIVIVPVFGIYYYLIHWRKEKNKSSREFIYWIIFPVILGISYWYLIAIPLPYFLELGLGTMHGHMEYIGNSLHSLIFSIIKNPLIVLELILRYDKTYYLLDMFKKTSFIPALAPDMLVVAFPAILQKLLVRFQVSVFDHYQNMIDGPMIIAMMYGFKRGTILISRLGINNRYLFSVIMLVLFTSSVFQNPHIFTGGSIMFYNPDTHNFLDYYDGVLEMSEMIPKNASVIADSFLFVYVYDRVDLFYISAYKEDWMSRIYSYDYVLIPLDNDMYNEPMNNEFTRKELVERLKETGYQVIAKEANLILLRR